MPLTEKGTEIMQNMKSQYGEEKGKQVFYASKNAGKISGVDDMNGGTEGLKSYGDDAHHHEIKGETGPEIADKKKHHDTEHEEHHEDKKHHDAMGLKHETEEPDAHKVVPKAADNEHGMPQYNHFPHDPYNDKPAESGFNWHNEMTCAQMKNGPLNIFKE